MARTPNDPLREQLDALVGGGVPQDVREQHLAGIRAHATSLGPAAVTAGRAAGVRWEARRRVAALGAAGALVVPGVAVASQGSVPGDALFGVKRTTEAVVGLVDGRVAATHRIEELEALLDRGAALDVLADALERAAVAVAALDDADDLEARLSLLEARVAALIAEAEAAVAPDEPATQEPAVAPTTPEDGPSPSGSTSPSEDDDTDTDDDDDRPSPSASANDDDDDSDTDDDASSRAVSEDDDTDTDDDDTDEVIERVETPSPTASGGDDLDDDDTDDTDDTDDDTSGSDRSGSSAEPDDDETHDETDEG